ncbi:MAG: hypothetical protein H6656_11710 [Ardenticatenaceae bacterium]|nr:hypothetical protein [Ardenticatenaceae bacterium]
MEAASGTAGASRALSTTSMSVSTALDQHRQAAVDRLGAPMYLPRCALHRQQQPIWTTVGLNGAGYNLDGNLKRR